MWCRLMISAFVLAYAAALGIFALGTWGLFGIERDPLSGVFVILLGLPWNRALDVFPESLRATLAAAAPTANLLILIILCHKMRSR
jgi:hypothetical protein